MKYTTEELLFALQLRELVAQRMTHDAPAELTLEEYRAWQRSNNAQYFKDAISELEGIAESIRTVRTTK